MQMHKERTGRESALEALRLAENLDTVKKELSGLLAQFNKEVYYRGFNSGGSSGSEFAIEEGGDFLMKCESPVGYAVTTLQEGAVHIQFQLSCFGDHYEVKKAQGTIQQLQKLLEKAIALWSDKDFRSNAVKQANILKTAAEIRAALDSMNVL